MLFRGPQRWSTARWPVHRGARWTPQLRLLVTFDEGGGVPIEYVTNYPCQLGNNDLWTPTGLGAGMEFTTNDHLGIGNQTQFNLPTQMATCLLVKRNTDTTARNALIFWTRSGNDAHRLGMAHENTATVLWDFGGLSAPNRLTYAYTKTLALERWAFVAGPSGSSIWLDGARVANQGTAITRSSASDNPISLNTVDGFGGSGDNVQIMYFAILEAEWGAPEIQEWGVNPWAYFASPSLLFSGTGGGAAPTGSPWSTYARMWR